MNKLLNVNRDVTWITVLLSLLLLFLSVKTVTAQESRVDLTALLAETQKGLPDADRVTMVWWVAGEFWGTVFAQDPSMSKEQVEKFIKTLSPYTLLVVVDGKIGDFGGVTYKSEQAIRDTIQLIDSKGVTYLPLSKEQIDPDTRNLLSAIKPALSNVAGQLGENMHFVLFPAKGKTGQKIADTRQEGSFSVQLGGSTFKWKLPLESLLPPKICPVDKEKFNGAWKFCPWHGEKLVSKPDK